MASALADVEWDACVLEPHRNRELEAHVRRQLGVLPSSVPYFTPVPWVVRSISGLSPYGAPPLALDAQLGDLIGLVVSQDNSCRYCFGIQRMLLRVHGMSEREIRRLEQDFLDAEIDPRAKAALDFSRRYSRASPRVSAADVAALGAAGFSREAILEIAFVSAQSVYMNRCMTLGAIPYQQPERLASLWLIPWLAPIMRIRIRQVMQRAVARSSTRLAEGDGKLWDFVVRAFRGTTCAPALRETLDAAFESPVLTKRAKALIFAVVARGLDCARSEEEARAILVESGLAEAEIEPILTHLASPALDPMEAALVPFARGTIRGRPLQLQQRTRALADAFGPEQTIEAIAVAALANALCRLGAITELA
jgi:AhpD family alkylhydroperoxidase